MLIIDFGFFARSNGIGSEDIRLRVSTPASLILLLAMGFTIVCDDVALFGRLAITRFTCNPELFGTDVLMICVEPSCAWPSDRIFAFVCATIGLYVLGGDCNDAVRETSIFGAALWFTMRALFGTGEAAFELFAVIMVGLKVLKVFVLRELNTLGLATAVGDFDV